MDNGRMCEHSASRGPLGSGRGTRHRSGGNPGPERAAADGAAFGRAFRTLGESPMLIFAIWLVPVGSPERLLSWLTDDHIQVTLYIALRDRKDGPLHLAGIFA